MDDQQVPSSYTIRELRNTVLPATPFLVPGRIPYGCWNHAALPGAYKTTIGWQIAEHIAYGKPLPGLDWQFAEHGSALIITPDETVYEVQDRDFAINPFGSLDTDDTDTDVRGMVDIHVRHDPEGMSITERMTWLLRLIDELETAHGRRIVWVQWDTLGNLLGVPNGVNAYDHAAPVRALNSWFASTRRVLFLPNHIGKDGRPIGSVAIDGYCNLNTVTEMQADQCNVGILKVRDKMRGGAHWECALKARDGLLELDDMSPQAAYHREGTHARRILELLTANGPGHAVQLAAALAISPNIVRVELHRMRVRDEIYRDDQRAWHLTDRGGSTTPPPPDPAICQGCWGPIHPTAQDGSGYHPCCEPTPPAPAPPSAPTPPPPNMQTAQVRTEAAPQPATIPDPPPAPELPKWRTMGSRETRPAELPVINASSHMDGKTKVWDHSPITAATELIMGDRDRGRLTPVWRAPLAPEIEEPLDGYHHWGDVPVRHHGQYKHKPEGQWISYDVAGSFLASYKTPLAIKALTPHYGPWTPKGAGVVLLKTPEWEQLGIGHPLGSRAVPGQWQWYWNPAVRTVMRLADDDLIERPEIRAMHLRVGYQGASEAMLEDFYKRMKLARETFPAGSEELLYIKNMYSGWLASASSGKFQVFQRPDWTGSIRAEAFTRLWGNAYSLLTAGVELVGIGNTDEIVVRPHPALDQLLPQTDTRLGKLKIKDKTDG